jgi:hypothetical protein
LGFGFHPSLLSHRQQCVTAHRTHNAVVGHQPLEPLAGVLIAAIGVMQQRIGLPCRQIAITREPGFCYDLRAIGARCCLRHRDHGYFSSGYANSKFMM